MYSHRIDDSYRCRLLFRNPGEPMIAWVPPSNLGSLRGARLGLRALRMPFKSLSQFLIFWGWRGEIIQAKLWSGTEKQKVPPCLVLFPLSRVVGHDFCTIYSACLQRLRHPVLCILGSLILPKSWQEERAGGGAVSRIKKQLSF